MDRQRRRSLSSQPCRSAVFHRPLRFEPIPGGYRVIDANGLPLAHVYGQPPDAVAFSDKRLTDDEAEKLARLIVRLPELIELERDRNKAKSHRRSPSPDRPVTLGDLARDGKLLEVKCSACKPRRHLYIEPMSLGLPKQLSVPEVADHLVCSVCGTRNDELKRPIHARPDARVPGVTGKYPRW
jgi:hypothetical protein